MQKYINAVKDNTIKAIDLKYGQLGVIVDHSAYNGVIVTKIYKGVVVVYSPNTDLDAFLSVWDLNFPCKVRVLSKEESVVLSNE